MQKLNNNTLQLHDIYGRQLKVGDKVAFKIGEKWKFGEISFEEIGNSIQYQVCGIDIDMIKRNATRLTLAIRDRKVVCEKVLLAYRKYLASNMAV